MPKQASGGTPNEMSRLPGALDANRLWDQRRSMAGAGRGHTRRLGDWRQSYSDLIAVNQRRRRYRDGVAGMNLLGILDVILSPCNGRGKQKYDRNEELRGIAFRFSTCKTLGDGISDEHAEISCRD